MQEFTGFLRIYLATSTMCMHVSCRIANYNIFVAPARPEGIMLQKVFIILFRISPKITSLCSSLFFLCSSLCHYSVFSTDINDSKNNNIIHKLLKQYNRRCYSYACSANIPHQYHQLIFSKV